MPGQDGRFDEPEQDRKLFLGGLNYSTTDEVIRTYFSKYGDIVDCCVIKNNESKKSKGFGFVTFSSRAEVDKVMHARKEAPHKLDNRDVDVRRAMPRDAQGPKIPSFKAFIGGIPKDTTDDTLRQYFGKFGNITELSAHQKNGFCFITFDDTDSVDQIVMQKFHTIGGKKCEGKKAFSKEEMREQKMREQQQQQQQGGYNGGGGPGGYRGGPGGGGGYGGPGGYHGGGGGGDYHGGYNSGGHGGNYGNNQGGWSGGPGGGGGYGGGYGPGGGGGNFNDFGSNYGAQNSNYGPVRGGGGGGGNYGGGRNQGPYPSNNGGNFGGGQGGPQGFGGGQYQGGGGGQYQGGGGGGQYQGGYGGGGGNFGKRF